jgi:hypothetical protein
MTGCTAYIEFVRSSSSPIPVRSEQTRVVLTSAAYVHLKQAEISKYTRNLAPASRAILLSGPAGTLSSSACQFVSASLN